jgi:hypothetical protein
VVGVFLTVADKFFDLHNMLNINICMTLLGIAANIGDIKTCPELLARFSGPFSVPPFQAKKSKR